MEALDVLGQAVETADDLDLLIEYVKWCNFISLTSVGNYYQPPKMKWT